MPNKNILGLLLVVAVIVGVISYLESHKPGRSGDTDVTELVADDMPQGDKAKQFDKAKELVQPSGFINTGPLALADLVGKQVILLDFWTYSCINCQRTLPYLNAWHEKYGDKGLTIIGVHTPEFEFEQKQENVQAAVEKYQIKYPVVLDNEYNTWKAYGNRYWPRKYLIDIDGFIVYDHIGEGAYEETERKIQELLAERAQQLRTGDTLHSDVVAPVAIERSLGVDSPEVYFGSQRNELLSAGQPLQTGIQELTAPTNLTFNQLALSGRWDIQPEFAKNLTANAGIHFRYKAKNVYMVAEAEQPVTVSIKQDGALLEKKITVQASQLYSIIENETVGEHTLELIIESPGLQAFTLTFG